MKITGLLLLVFAMAGCGSRETGNYYSVFTSQDVDGGYELQGNAHVDDQLSILYFDVSEETSVKLSGNLNSIKGNIQLIYVDPSGAETVIADDSARKEDTLDVDSDILLSEGENCFAFRGNETEFKFELLFSGLDGDKMEWFYHRDSTGNTEE